MDNIKKDEEKYTPKINVDFNEIYIYSSIFPAFW